MTNVPFNQFCLPGEVEKGVKFVTVAGPKREKKEKDTINAKLTLRQSLRQTSDPAGKGGGEPVEDLVFQVILKNSQKSYRDDR